MMMDGGVFQSSEHGFFGALKMVKFLRVMDGEFHYEPKW